jgi:hypothetical protein
VAALVEERAARRRRSAEEIARQLIDSRNLTERANLGEGEPVEPLRSTLTETLKKRLRQREARSREAVQGLYRHQTLVTDESGQELLDTDLFTGSGWELFGLSRERLLITGAITGALAGGGVDALLGGASLAMGAGIGALIGGVGAWLGGSELAKVKVLGEPLGGQVVQVGPVKAPNFPWVLLGRAWLHHRLVSERNHARREAISLAVQGEQNLMDTLPDALSRQLARAFAKLERLGNDPDFQAELASLIEAVLEANLARE